MTASLAALMETPEPAPILFTPVEAVPEAIEIAADPSSGADVALCEVEIIEASGPIQMAGARTENGFSQRREGPPPLPAIPSRATAVSQGRSIGAALEPAGPAVRAGVRRAERNGAWPSRVATHAGAAAARE